MIVKVCHPKREDHFFNLSRYIRRDPVAEKTVDNFASLSRYMTRDAEFKAVATNCGCDEHDLDTAEQVVLATQNLNTRARKKSLHLVVSFAKGEYPPEEQLALIEHRLLGSIGMADLQRIRVVHDDTDNLHMHIAVNRIHPESLRSIQPSRDYPTLQKCARELEHELGLEILRGRDGKYQDLELARLLRERKDDIRTYIDRSENWEELNTGLSHLGIGIRARRNGAVFITLEELNHIDAGITLAASKVDRTFSRNALETRFGALTQEAIVLRTPTREGPSLEISDAALRQERHRGTESFQTWALEQREKIANLIEVASSWDDVHQSLAELNVDLVPYRAGLSLVNTNGRGAIAASRIDRAMSRNSLEARLGEFEPPLQAHEQAQQEPMDGYTERPFVDPSNLWDQYVQDRDALRLRLDRERERRKADRDRAYAAFARKYRDEAQAIRRSAFLDRFGKRLAFNRLAQRRKRAYEQLKTRSAPIRSRKPPSYRQWLLQQALSGHTSARSALRAMSARLAEPVAWEFASSGQVQGESKTHASRVHPNAVFRDGAVEIEHAGIPLIDDGDRIHVTDNELESVRALLESARRKYDSPLEIDGGVEFRTSVAICALEMPDIRFADRDLQQQVERLRTRQHPESEHGLER